MAGRFKSVTRWGFNIGPLHVCWWDMWERRPLLEISWITRKGARVLVGLALRRSAHE